MSTMDRSGTGPTSQPRWAVTRMHADIAPVLKAPRVRMIVVTNSGVYAFKPRTVTDVTIAWLPSQRAFMWCSIEQLTSDAPHARGS